MATTSVAVQRTTSGRKYGAIDWWGGWRTCILACLGFSVLFIALGLRTGLTALVLLLACAAIMAWLSRRKIGGQTGDVLGALEQATECLVLLVAAARF